MAGGPDTLAVQSLGFLRQPQVRRLLALAGWRIRLGWPQPGEAVGVWGRKPVSARGRWVAARTGVPLVTVEDGFLRSVAPGVTGAPPLSLVIDDLGFYADAARPSRLERLLAESELDPAQHRRAQAGIARLSCEGLSKYTPPVPPRPIGQGHVLVVDQTAGDASIAGAGAGPETFRRLLEAARAEHPGHPILIKAHPDVMAGAKRGHYGAVDARGGVELLADPVNPWDAIAGARAVYTVSSQMGYEAVLAGIPVRCFGMAFYAGWGLTEDESRCPRRTRRLSVEALFHGCHLAYPIYYDPWRDRLGDFETAADAIACQVRAETPEPGVTGEVFAGVRLWKRRNLAAFRPRYPRAPAFVQSPGAAAARARRQGRALWIWASKASAADLTAARASGGWAGQVEDGFLRSVGLGAELTAAASFVFDRQGIYFDAGAPSDLEDLIAAAAGGAADAPRAQALARAIVEAGVTKYNVGASAVAAAPAGRRVVLVPGQVEDDASIDRGCGALRTNLALLEAARAGEPDAFLIYKPHPDVEAGLRVGQVPAERVAALADAVAERASAAALLGQADAVWTLTSLMGFEALLRGKAVTCLGMPFYAGWGLTRDLGPACPRRVARPSLAQLVWAALIAYPSYRDPVSGLPCAPELVVERLAAGVPSGKATLLSRLQGVFASQAWLWR